MNFGINEILSNRVGRNLCRHRDAYCIGLSRSMRYTAVDVQYAEMQDVHTFLLPLSPQPFNFEHRCFGLYRYSLT